MNTDTSTKNPDGYQMNSLIIVGNGFDLAHKMKTSFKSFMIWYLCGLINKTPAIQPSGDCLMNIKKNHIFTPTEEIPTLERYVENHLNIRPRRNKSFAQAFTDRDRLQVAEKELAHDFKLTPKTNFMEHLIEECIPKGWVDLEHEYYKKLKNLLKAEEINQNQIISLNTTMSY